MPPEIRRVDPSELPAWLEAITTTFLDRHDVVAMTRQVTEYWDFQRVWGGVRRTGRGNAQDVGHRADRPRR